MTTTKNGRAFIQMLIESRLREESLKDIGIYLQYEHDRLNSVTRSLTELEQVKYNKEKKILTMEED